MPGGKRHRLVQDQNWYANWIKHLLLSNGIKTGEKNRGSEFTSY